MQAKNFSDLVTFTRATTGTWLNPATGFMETAAINVPRFEAKGLLFGQQRTNIALQSNTFSNASWVKNGASVGASVTSPDGTANAVKLVESATNAAHNFSQTGKVVTGGTKYCRSVFAKADGSGRRLQLATDTTANWVTNTTVIFNLDTGTIASQSPAVNDGAGIESWGNGWYRCWLVGTTIASPATVNFNVALNNGGVASYLGDGTSGCYVFGAQFEAGDGPSSYIPTTTAQVTRSADLAFVADSGWLHTGEGTLVAEMAHYAFASSVAASLGTTSPTPSVRVLTTATGQPRAEVVDDASVTSFSVNLGANLTLGQVSKQALAYKQNDFQFSTGGLLSAVDTSGNLPTISRMTLGARGVSTSHMSGYLRRIKYYPYRLTANELQALTT